MIGLIERALLVAATASLLAAGVASALTPAIPLLRAFPARARVPLLEAIVLLPWAAPLVILAAGLAPSVLALVWPSFDHCRSHDDHHDHLCLLHPPHAALDLSTLLACLVIGAIIVRASGLLPRVARAHLAARQLLASGRRETAGTWSLPTDLPVVAVVGAWRPEIVVSEGARRRVSDEALEIALAHERAHLARHDVLRGVLVALASAAHGPATFAQWTRELSLAREQVCDEAAADHVGDRVRVAEAILEVVRAMSHAPFLPELASVSFGADALEARVASLLADRPRVSRPALALFVGGLVALIAALPAVHHVLESLLALAH